jgi:hypothetical protein
MKYEIIKTEDYLFAVDEKSNKIIAHLPFDYMPLIINLPVLPPITDECRGFESLADNWVWETNEKKWSNNDDTAADNFGSFRAGYCKAQEVLLKRMNNKLLSNPDFDEKTLSMFKSLAELLLREMMPTHFECELELKEEWFGLHKAIKSDGTEIKNESISKPKTMFDFSGNKVLIGKYIW